MPQRNVVAGQLDRTISFNIIDGSRSSTSGAAKRNVLSTIANVPAAFIPVKGAELIRAGQVIDNFDARFLVRFRTDIAPKDEVVYNGVEYDIYQISEIGRQQGLEILAKARNQ